MADWKAYVRRRLEGRELSPEREAEVVEELSQLLDDFYAEAPGADPEEWARTQIPQWGPLVRQLAKQRPQRRSPGYRTASPSVGGEGLMNGFWQDLRQSLRLPLQRPAFASTALVTLALGIGLNTAVFSVVNAILFKSLPVREPGRLISVYNEGGDQFVDHVPLAYPDYIDLRDRNETLSDLFGYAFTPLALEWKEDPEMVMGEIVTGNYFSSLGVQASLGRTFRADEDEVPGRDPVAVLSYRAWQTRFGADPGVLGETLRLNGHLFTVIGVGAGDFNGLTRGLTPELWVPMAMGPSLRSGGAVNVGDASPGLDLIDDRRRRWVWVAGRLGPGVSFEQAQAELISIGNALKEAYPETNRDRTIKPVATNTVRILPDIDGILYGVSFVLMAVVALILLIASANVANMLLAQAVSRRKEMALRLSLGAGRSRLVRQLLTESLVLSLAGGALGILLAWWSNALLNSMSLPGLPVQIELGLEIDYRVLGFAIAISTLTAVVFGLVPALQASRTDLASTLSEESATSSSTRAKRRLHSGLVVAQVSLCLLLLISAGLTLRSVRNARNIEPGFNPVGLITAGLEPSLAGYSPPQVDEFYRRLREKVLALPSVESVSYASHLPLTFEINVERVAIEGEDALDPKKWPNVDGATVGPDYFESMGIPLLAGRGFAPTDELSKPQVAIVNQTFAARFWPGEEAVGRRLRVGGVEGYWEVIGVAGDGKYRTLGEEPRPYLYRSLTQVTTRSRVLLARTRGADSHSVLGEVRQLARDLDESVPISGLKTLDEAIGPALLLPRAGAAFFGLFGLLGLVLSAVGIYGVIAHGVSQRTHEIGIRMALGAERFDILRLMVRQGLGLTLLGVVLGLGGAWVATRMLSTVLYGISATDALTFSSVSLFLILVALVASFLPARRAARVDPMATLRHS